MISILSRWQGGSYAGPFWAFSVIRKNYHRDSPSIHFREKASCAPPPHIQNFLVSGCQLRCIVLKFLARRKRAFISFHFYWKKSKTTQLSFMQFSSESTGIVTSWNWLHDIIDMEEIIFLFLYLVAYLSSYYEKAINALYNTSSLRSCQPSVYHTEIWESR